MFLFLEQTAKLNLNVFHHSRFLHRYIASFSLGKHDSYVFLCKLYIACSCLWLLLQYYAVSQICAWYLRGSKYCTSHLLSHKLSLRSHTNTLQPSQTTSMMTLLWKYKCFIFHNKYIWKQFSYNLFSPSWKSLPSASGWISVQQMKVTE